MPKHQMPMKTWKCGRFDLPLGRKTYVMGIINATPDSFSGDGTWNGGEAKALEIALAKAERMVEEGADILDIGGESTRPGALAVSPEEELRRVLPLVKLLVARLEVPISVDTTKSQVARACLDAGVSIINDISGGTFDARLLPAIAASDCGVILMHLRGTPQTMKASAAFRDAPNAGERDLKTSPDVSPGARETPVVCDVIAEIKEFWAARVRVAQEAGIATGRIVLDAGFGFGKSVEENLEILRRGRELSDFGFPTLSAISRKSTLARVLAQAQQPEAQQPEAQQQAQREAQVSDVAPADVASCAAATDERLWATAAGVALAIAGGCDIVRVHDVREMVQVARLADAATRVP